MEVISERPSAAARLRNVWRFRELLRNLIRKELKVKYKSSVLGFVWTLLNPALYLVVFSIVFKFVLQTPVPNFAVFLLSGLLAWNFFSAAVTGGAVSVVANASLVQKVWMPREVLPLAAVGAALMHFFFQLSVLVGALVIFQRPPAWGYLPLLIPALLVLIVFASALGIGLSAINVYLRDTQHLLELLLVAWFWMSCIVYPFKQMWDRLGEWGWVVLLNPVISVVLVFQRVLYNPPASADILLDDVSIWWYLRNLGIVAAASVALLLLALWIFGRLEDNLAEEI